MKRISTNRLLTLGMALYADKKTMEQRVRGIFARRSSTFGALFSAALMISALLLGCFTTACRPAPAKATLPPATKTEILTVQPAALLGGEAAVQTVAANSYAGSDAYADDVQEHGKSRSFVAPAVSNIYREPRRGEWTLDAAKSDSADAKAAVAAFLPVANAIFRTGYTADQATAAYHKDETGFRAHLWRIETADGALIGAIDADTLAFISADFLAAPDEALHESYQHDEDGWGRSFDKSAAVDCVVTALGGTAEETMLQGGRSSNKESERCGWTEKEVVAARLSDGRYALIGLYADAGLTVYAAGVCPDMECMYSGVYWRADLDSPGDTVVQVHPADFRKGEPGRDDMPVAEAYDFYYRFVEAAGVAQNGEAARKEPNATFYVDHSGARENYWHIEGEYATFDLASRTGHMFAVRSSFGLGYGMKLTAIPYEWMGGDRYVEATQALFEALFGEGSVAGCSVNAVYDLHYCTMALDMADGTSYEIMYEDGLIREVAYFASGLFADPNWAADWQYINTETGETFHIEW